MKRKRHSAEQIISKLREAEVLNYKRVLCTSDEYPSVKSALKGQSSPALGRSGPGSRLLAAQ